MQKTITQPKIKLPLGKTPEEIREVWRKAAGIWRKKKLSPLLHLRKIRKEWEKRVY